jgi:hypothetical protein
MRLAWPEKASLVVFGLITLVMLFLGMGQNPDPSEYCQQLRSAHHDWTSAESYCFVTAAQHWSAFAWIEGFLFLKVVLPVWIVLRVLDIAGGGPAIRRGHFNDWPPPWQKRKVGLDLRPTEWTSSEPEWRRRLRSRY